MLCISAYLFAFICFQISGSLALYTQSAGALELDIKVESTSPKTFLPGAAINYESIFGPVVTSNFPDPAIIHFKGLSYAFATNNRGIGKHGMIRVQVATSVDNQTWTILEGHDALPSVPGWQSDMGVWAPDVIQLDDGTFVMYYAGELNSSPQHHCIGAATSNSITGPYRPLDTPFACPNVTTKGGAIDPDGFLDPSTGKRYVTYKVDGNSIGHGGDCQNTNAPIVPTPILLQEVSAHDGLTLIGEPQQILDRDASDGPLIEAPSLHRTNEGIYFLFYSSHCFTTELYNTKYATSTKIGGPYTKNGGVLFDSGDGPQLLGPGGTDIIKGGNMIVFHGHLDKSNIKGDLKKATDHSGRRKRSRKSPPGPPLVRGMYTAVATFNGTRVTLAGPIPGP